VFAIYLAQVMLIAAIGSAIGLAAGAAFPFAVSWAFGQIIPIPLEARLHVGELSLAFAYGLLTALVFALWPLGRVHDVPVSALFREAALPEWHRPRARYLLLLAVSVALLLAVAIGLAYDRKIAAIFVAAAVITFLVLRLMSNLVMDGVKRLPRPRMTMLRLALANISRPGAITPSVILSLGLGLALLVTVVEIDANLRRQLAGELPERAPDFFFIDIPSAEADRFETFMRDKAPQGRFERVPMLRGRIISVNGVRAEDIKAATDAEWVLESDRGITYADEVPPNSRLVEGEWWPRGYDGPPLVSFDKKLADGIGLKLGDQIVVNVLGRSVTVRLANTRSLDWQSLGINFIMVFSPNTFRGAPHTQLATLSEETHTPQRDAEIVKAVAANFPTVTAVRVRDAIEAVGGMVTNLVLAIRGASAVTLLAAMLVLGGALAAGQHARVYDAVILRTLGATRARLIGAYALEYLLVGLAAAVFGVAAGSLAGWFVVTRLMQLDYVWQATGPLAVVAIALVVTVAMGLMGTIGALNQKPAPVLRNL
jgi:putative ABC transport system permease protein